MNVLRGNGVDLSIVGAKRCNTQDNVLLAVILVGIIILAIIGNRVVNADVTYKKFLRYNFLDGDIYVNR